MAYRITTKKKVASIRTHNKPRLKNFPSLAITLKHEIVYAHNLKPSCSYGNKKDLSNITIKSQGNGKMQSYVDNHSVAN